MMEAAPAGSSSGGGGGQIGQIQPQQNPMNALHGPTTSMARGLHNYLLGGPASQASAATGSGGNNQLSWDQDIFNNVNHNVHNNTGSSYQQAMAAINNASASSAMPTQQSSHQMHQLQNSNNNHHQQYRGNTASLESLATALSGYHRDSAPFAALSSQQPAADAPFSMTLDDLNSLGLNTHGLTHQGLNQMPSSVAAVAAAKQANMLFSNVNAQTSQPSTSTPYQNSIGLQHAFLSNHTSEQGGVNKLFNQAGLNQAGSFGSGLTASEQEWMAKQLSNSLQNFGNAGQSNSSSSFPVFDTVNLQPASQHLATGNAAMGGAPASSTPALSAPVMIDSDALNSLPLNFGGAATSLGGQQFGASNAQVQAQASILASQFASAAAGTSSLSFQHQTGLSPPQAPMSSQAQQRPRNTEVVIHPLARATTSLVIPSDATFLDPVHIFLRTTCIEIFIAAKEHTMCPGRGARALKVGQVGLRCIYCKDMPRQELTRQAVCFPSKRDTVFESVRNYQRVHLEHCPAIPKETKQEYRMLIESDFPNRKSQRFVKAYYSEAASELGLIETSKGLVFGLPPNTSGVPSERVLAVMRAAESPAKSAAFWKSYNLQKTLSSSGVSGRDKCLEMRKFEHMASEGTRLVLMSARREENAFVLPQDFPTVSDFEFLLYKQVQPCKPSPTTLKRRGISPEDFDGLSGLCCKHCAREHKGGGHHKGMWFPMNFQSMGDSSFSQSLLNHMMTCNNVPREVKNAFDELRRLASENSVTAKRGSKKKFLEKIWDRMENYYA